MVSPEDCIEPQSVPVLELKEVTKRFGHVFALQNVDFIVYPGEIVALVGDNGAGKSTLIGVASGVYKPDAGHVLVDGNEVYFASCREAQQHGISTVFQDLALIDGRDMAANIFLGREPTTGVAVNSSAMVRESLSIMRRVTHNVPPAPQLVGSMSGGQRQAVAISRAISQKGRLVFMDEPTAALGVRESKKVMDLILSLKEGGISVVIASPNLRHVFPIAERISVLRGGRSVGTRRTCDTSYEEITTLIVGAEML
jgi:ABC-type sugar transport system ATPase subunit